MVIYLNNKFCIKKEDLPNGFEYPQSYYRIINLNLVDFDVWYLLWDERLINRYNGLKTRYPNRSLIPFAKRDDNDDIACFELGKGEGVFIIHDFASPGYEERQIFEDIFEWLKYTIVEMKNFD
ncbi:hypothetical protein KHQ81_00615 [Mycoplasmatota bacterium]|nr:hypothetical protein KHQ81_00615 [Mycoplasmatota bacterium]